ncbi:hypothetical protein CVT26_004128 [Gymnopilus dilepis]|uniref:Alpha/beta hydrolase fold-3 domain-containing protein n=1 Tax=Gymnopilus dilepis TaxID=231916 RepID=A0A409YVE2_9AGAR|nr:hypothetical protein CVT26_004128 [Gymnopilus dilepis]
MDPIERRKELLRFESEFVKTLPPLPATLTEEYLTIPGDHEKQLKVIRPTHLPATGSAPLILLFHGGGFRAGTIEQLTRPAREFAETFGAVVVSAGYKLVPEHVFPENVEDAYDTLLWVARNSKEKLGVDLKNGFVVGGYSAGANIAAVLATLATARGDLPPSITPTGSFLIIPTLLVPSILPKEYTPLYTSRVENKDGAPGGPIRLSTEVIDGILAALNPDVHSPLFSPFNCAEDVLKQLPRTYIQVGGRDCLRDDGVVYEAFLRARGVDVRLDVSEGLGHTAYSIFTQKRDVEEEELKGKTMEGIKWLFRL